MAIAAHASALAALLLGGTSGGTSCLDIKPKTLGQQGIFDFSSLDTNGSSTFKFNFAMIQTTRSTSIVYVQGSINSKSSIIGTCNLAGTGCACYFADTDGKELGATDGTGISYDEPGNYFRCTVPSDVDVAEISTVTMKNLNGDVTSDAFEVKTLADISLAELIGADLDANRVRTISRYYCEYNYLQKSGTTTQTFTCSVPNPNITCDTGNFCLLKARFPFYLYADTVSTNSGQKIADRLYNAGSTNSICGLQIKQINCVQSDTDPTDTFGTPVPKFGLYGISQGLFTIPVNLPPGPDLAVANMGFAAKTSSITGECPPGLAKQVFFTTTIDSTSITPDHNFPTNQVATEVSDPDGAVPSAFKIAKFGGGGSATFGNCNGTSCGMPISQATDDVKGGTQIYSKTGQTTFCVIPSTKL
jgi:hypothetical protein